MKGGLNFVGEVSEVLFGTMGDEAQYHNEHIKH
jgi:hypothetical protein